jgi:hypothetical protein
MTPMIVTTAHGSFLLTPAFALIISITLSLLSLFSICQRNQDYAGSGKIFQQSFWLHCENAIASILPHRDQERALIQ